MEQLAVADLTALVAGVRDLSAIRTGDAFPAAAVAFVRALIPGVCHSYTSVDLRRGRITVVLDPAEMMFPKGEEAAFLRYAPEHPLIAHFARAPDHRALAISDFLTRRAFHRTGLYADFYRRIDTEDQLAIGLPAPPGASVGIVVHRGGEGFSARDRLLLDLARPHLAQAYRNAWFITAMHRAFAESEHPAMVLDAEGEVRSAPDHAWQMLATYFDPVSSRHSLPEAVRRWVGAQRRRLDAADDAPVLSEPLVVERGERRLTLRLFTGTAGQGESLLVLHERSGDPAVDLRAQGGLTAREREVAALVAGKTNREIAEELYLSEKTVEWHVSNTLRKLGFRARAELAVWAASVGLVAVRTHPRALVC